MATNFGWKSMDTPSAAADIAEAISCSAGGNKSQEYISAIELTGTAGGGSDGATLAYEWTLLDPDGNQRNYWITGSNLSSMSFNPVDYPFGGNWVATLVVSSSDSDDLPASSSAIVTLGSSSWIRFNPNYGVEYHYTGATAASGPYQTLVWADSGTFTEVTCSVPPADKQNITEFSIQWVNTTLAVGGSGSLHPSGTLYTVETKLIYDAANMLTTSDEFYAGWVIGNPQEHDGHGSEDWASVDLSLIMSWYGGIGESNTQKVAIKGTNANISWITGKTGADRLYSAFTTQPLNQDHGRSQLKSVKYMRVSGGLAREANLNSNTNTQIVKTGSIMKLGAVVGRGNEGLTLTASVRAKWYYRINRMGIITADYHF